MTLAAAFVDAPAELRLIDHITAGKLIVIVPKISFRVANTVPVSANFASTQASRPQAAYSKGSSL